MGTFGLMIVALVLVGLVRGQPKDKTVEWSWVDNGNRFPVDEPAMKNMTELPTSHIINGEVATYGDHPYMCNVERYSGGRWYFICGCVIHNVNTVLTAAHCVNGRSPSMFRVRAGDHLTYRTDQFEVTKGIVRINVHPGWRNSASRGFPNDLATMKVDPPFVFNSHVNRARIPRRRTSLPVDCQLMGWGKTETGRRSYVLKKVTIGRLTKDECAKKWGGLVTSRQTCFMDAGRPDSSCNGDSGGPAMCGQHLVGVTSWGVVGCKQGYPSVYTYLPYYRGWIFRNDF